MSQSVNNQQAFQDTGWSIFSFFTVALVINAVTIAIISTGDLSVAIKAPVTAMVIFMNIMAMIGLNANIDDAQAILAGLSDEEKQDKCYQNWINAPFIMYRSLMVIGFGALALTQLWSMYLA